jgi:hypothetical protein
MSVTVFTCRPPAPAAPHLEKLRLLQSASYAALVEGDWPTEAIGREPAEPDGEEDATAAKLRAYAQRLGIPDAYAKEHIELAAGEEADGAWQAVADATGGVAIHYGEDFRWPGFDLAVKHALAMAGSDASVGYGWQDGTTASGFVRIAAQGTVATSTYDDGDDEALARAAREAFTIELRRLFARQISTKAFDEPTTAGRAERAEPLMRAWSDARSEDDYQTDLGDLLCELMHWCRWRGVDFDEALCAGLGHFIQEMAMAEAYVAGYRAHGAGLPLEPNPHDGPDGDGECATLWHRGWQDAAAGKAPLERLGEEDE